MPIGTDDSRSEPAALVSSREPMAQAKTLGENSIGALGFNDAVLMVGIAWFLLGLLWFSVRTTNV